MSAPTPSIAHPRFVASPKSGSFNAPSHGQDLDEPLAGAQHGH
jgi:hypothetical protein